MSEKHSGSCHCGAIGVELTTSIAPDEMRPRMCGCAFCCKHPSKWFADPDGRLALRFDVEPIRYRFGTRTADFVLCPNCGVIVAATCTVEGTKYGILNLNCIEPMRDWPEPSAKSDFDGEGTGDRLARRAKNWMPVIHSAAA
ncbi:MAG: hypothetical protein QNJ15_00775 [Erythrobacter sp.]|nr:hypothetical protein [Erythrobacter sp.]